MLLERSVDVERLARMVTLRDKAPVVRAASETLELAALDGLVPPDDAAGPHAEWLAAGRALNDVFQSTDDQLSSLDVAGEVNAVVSELPLRDLQAAYRTACQTVAALAGESDDPTAVIVCQPPDDGA